MIAKVFAMTIVLALGSRLKSSQRAGILIYNSSFNKYKIVMIFFYVSGTNELIIMKSQLIT